MEKFKNIINDDFLDFVKYVETNKLNEIITDELYKILLFLQKYNFIEILLKNKYYPPIMTVFYAIKNNLIEYIDLLKVHKIKLDIINTNGLTPVEYAIFLYSKNKIFHNMVILLNNFKYTRNPKWFDMITQTKLYNIQPKSKIDEDTFLYIKNTKEELTLIKLNNCILLSLIKNNKIFEIVTFIKQNLNFINSEIILEDIMMNQRKEVLHYIENFIPKNNQLINVYFKLHLYEKIMKLTDFIDYDDTMNFLIKTLDLHGVVFLHEYLKKDSITSITNSNGETLLHLLCKHYNVNSDNVNLVQLQKFVQILLNYHPQIVDIPNNQGYTPIFLVCQHNFLTELLIVNSNLNLKVNNNTYLHHLIEYGNLTVFNKVFMYETKISNIINEKNNNGETPLLLASRLQKQNICNVLLRLGADIQQNDNNGNTVFHYICLYNLNQIEINSIPEIKNNNNETPSDCVVKYINSEFNNL